MSFTILTLYCPGRVYVNDYIRVTALSKTNTLKIAFQ